ncbi:MAG: C39 family peptidase [Clostridia bacterium]|nr:C39 family peptidase [Clostridia bacterium]
MKNKKRNIIIAVCMVLTVLILMIIDQIIPEKPDYPLAQSIIEPFAKSHGIKMKEYPDEIKAMLEKNSETEEFVLNYPLKKDSHESFSMEEYKNLSAVPRFMQWDSRWGYEEYAGSIMGIAGCGPVCLSMVAIYLLNDISLDPLYVARFAEENDFATKGNGTKWILMSEGAELLGLHAEELPLDKNVITNALNDKKPIICIMGAGDFTTTGHYIVLTEYSEEGFSVLDPNSKARSGQKWTYEKLESQIRNIWAFSV